MNRRHLQAFLWLRWRLTVNQLKRNGIVNTVILGLLAVAVGGAAVVLFVGCFLLGWLALADVEPSIVMYVWDGVVVAFLFYWLSGLISDLQRSELLALEKFLHLPVSLHGAFLLNYLGSLLGISTVVFVPAMIGLSLGLVLGRGLAMLWQLPLLAAFLLMVTALTYQFQGWLASVAVNPRRRRTIIAGVVMAFVLITQVPNFWFLRMSTAQPEPGQPLESEQDEDEFARLLHEGKISQEQYHQRWSERQRVRQRFAQRVERLVTIVNLAVPPGWLPLGAKTAAQGAILPSALATVGLGLIGTMSLWRSYRTTLRLHTGQFTAGNTAATVIPATAPPQAQRSVAWLEQRIPGLSEQASAIVLANWRMLSRAPEAKWMLLMPLLMLLLLGSLLGSYLSELPDSLRPLLACGGMFLILFCMLQLIGNPFGHDRSGFQVYVFSAVPRQDILLSKNLVYALPTLGLGLALTALQQVCYPMPWIYFLALPPQFLSMYLLFCLLANGLAIFVPVALPTGGAQPVKVSGLAVLTHMLFLLLYPLALLPTLVPLGVALILEQSGQQGAGALGLLFALLECAAVVFIYRWLLSWQGSWLQAQEQRILEIVTTRAE